MAKKAFNLKKMGKNDYFKTIIVIVMIVVIVLGFFFGMQLVLGAAVPIRVVDSGSMCVTYDAACDGWSHPFDHTLHVGDIIIIQKVNPADLNANYPNSDIIVFKNPNGVTPIVHRIVSEQDINGTLYFKTKGDGNGPVTWPSIPNYYDNIPDAKGVPQNFVEGKVILRIPWFGWITLFMRGNSWGLPVVVALIILLLVIEFILPVVKGKKKKAEQQSKHASQP
jgi:signal peptidase I